MSSQNIPTRDRILKSTWQLLEAGNGNAVRMSDIAKAAKISRQALYLHFPNRADLLTATTRYLDEVHDIEAKLAKSRGAASGTDRLEAWVETWGNYIPTIFGVAKALMAMQETDEEAAAAWNDRILAIRDGCEKAVQALKADGKLTDKMSEEEATDLLLTLLSVRNWEQLRITCNWTQDRYIDMMQQLTAQALVKSG
ncbi:TetR/AcrR family transcriptional regulator [Pseudovibrio brasiliensis]|uniref:TetR/AcrR family transcriptional regulator n=1 Tax=Pseudovibrio brasiliensis TaxID=1898042 RepID=A0ABX8AQU2_9HYPH|nr:TetR/AcrR family transcriptional regulator [Pseudovibrio brasiliensis]QUS57090.1 TetR/AcrR family transcriptional regulator [Pseudovibrio brasiliensis]